MPSQETATCDVCNDDNTVATVYALAVGYDLDDKTVPSFWVWLCEPCYEVGVKWGFCHAVE